MNSPQRAPDSSPRADARDDGRDQASDRADAREDTREHPPEQAGDRATAVTLQSPGDDARRAAESAARRSYGKLIAFLAARTGDVALAEDCLSDAFAKALVDWPAHGLPDNAEAWLLTVARRRMIDAGRHQRIGEAVARELEWLFDELDSGADNARDIPDDRLRLMFACAHPAIDATVRAPLILQTTLGFDAATIGSAFLVAPATMGQRLVRAKTKIRQARIPFCVPEPDQLGQRLQAVLDAIYAAYAEGWSDPSGTDPRQRNLADESLWLGRVVTSLLPDAAEALGLLALMLHAQARRGARRDHAGHYVPLDEQDTSRWEHALIAEAEALLHRASRLRAPGRYQLEAAVQSAHAVRRITLCSARSDHRVAGGSNQPRDRAGSHRRCGCGAGAARHAGRRSAPGRLPTVLGGAWRTARTGRRCTGCGAGTAARDRARARPGGAPFPAVAAAGRAGRARADVAGAVRADGHEPRTRARREANRSRELSESA
jgi:RNA polymerase sigma-70 factor (ECF subfamily)